MSGLPGVDPVRQRLKRRLGRALRLVPAAPGRVRDGGDELVLGDGGLMSLAIPIQQPPGVS